METTTNSTIGWHQDTSDPTVSRYWDGERWTGELRWNGGAWVDAAAVPTPAPVVVPVSVAHAPAATPPVLAVAAGPTVGSMAKAAPTVDSISKAVSGLPMTKTSWTLFSGCALAGISVFLPWVEAATSYQRKSVGPSASGLIAALLLALVGGAVWLGAPSREGRLSMPRVMGLAAVSGVMALAVFGTFALIGSAVSESESQYGSEYGMGYAQAVKPAVGPAIGLFLWSAGIVLIVVGTVRAWRAHTTASVAS